MSTPATIPPEERAHALLSASGSPIWLTCTPSARFGEHEPDEETDYSREGNWAHAVAAHRLRIFLGRENENEVAQEVDLPDYKEFYTPDANEAINGYIRRCVRAIADARADSPDALVLCEQRLDFSDWVPEGFGTGDLVIIANRVLRARDLKFGKGIQVFADDNTQLMLYALGAVAAYRGIYDFDEVMIEIDQPRLGHIDALERPMPVRELLLWADSFLKERAALAWKGEGPFVPGDHCRFCNARRKCKARADHVADLADAAFAANAETPVDPRTLTDEQIASFIPRLDMLVKWAHDMKEHALARAVKEGKRWPGLKLVTGRSNRSITDEAGLAEVLMLEGYERALLFEPPAPPPGLLGLGALEKVVGKKKFAELSKGFVTKPRGKPVLVPESDLREEWTPTENAENDFEADQ